MGAISFYLKPIAEKAETTDYGKGTKFAKKGKPENAAIYLQWKYNGKRLRFHTKHSINPKNWSKAKQRVKSNTQTAADGQHSLNDLLDNLEQVLQRAYNTEIKNGIPQPDVLKQHLINFINQNEKTDTGPTLYKLIERFINNEIHYKGAGKAKNTIGKYKTTLAHLQAFEKAHRYPIDFNTITLDFFYKFVAYLKSITIKDKDGTVIQVGLAQNSIAKDIQVIKTFMNEALDLGYTTNIQHKHKKFFAAWEAVDAVYLSEKEIMSLFKYDLSKHKRYEQVRDLFVFGCYTGLRFSDYSGVKPENIVDIDGDLFIKLVTIKTGEQVIIPCNPVVLQIFDKYGENPNRLPKTISNQKFNEYIKEACKVAKMDDTGRLIGEPDRPLYDCISSHTARRSFATNLYLEGYPTIEIMKITGHRTEKAFLTYIKVSKLDAAKRLSAHIKLRWSEKLMKIV